jgi:hypothetical protein
METKVKQTFWERDKDGKDVAVVKELDYTPMRVRYPNGYEGIMKRHVAEIEAKRGKLEILGPGTPAPKPEPKPKGKGRGGEDEE